MATAPTTEVRMTTPSEFTATLSRPRPNERIRRRVGTLVLEVVEGPHTGSRYEITRQVTTIGRGAPSDIIIDDPALSAVHVELELEAHHVVVRDMKSRNGTWHGLGRV